MWSYSRSKLRESWALYQSSTLDLGCYSIEPKHHQRFARTVVNLRLCNRIIVLDSSCCHLFSKNHLSCTLLSCTGNVALLPPASSFLISPERCCPSTASFSFLSLAFGFTPIVRDPEDLPWRFDLEKECLLWFGMQNPNLFLRLIVSLKFIPLVWTPKVNDPEAVLILGRE